MAGTLPLWRSLLYVPVTNQRFVEKASARGADVIKLDLEDSIPPAEKPAARAAVRDSARLISDAGTEVLVRINRPWRMSVLDLEAAIWPEVSGLCLPKLESADHLAFIDETVEELERERDMAVGSIRFMGLIETPRGLNNVREIAKASPRLMGLSLGQEDYSAALGMPSLGPGDLIEDMRLVQRAAREADILPLGYAGSIAEITDMEAFRASAQRARALGMEGGSCVHPAQVPILNEVFSPTAEEVETADAMVAAYDAAMAEGLGAVSFRGKMIDVPVVDRARRVLVLRDRIAGKS
ncbi:HpcH/HpaI aldolase/citrate lyase family protein [Nisaea denitrificans]|uniref:HpcH/HpaI aldolase/citrate lyase family protein n=1 Tax=Nisaea denitrificans TaxID=390877 RepID=UPI0003F6F497|nr:CoA ester lyase [Nisaea denitrificans]